ncbi:MAG: DUF748 domain-containing protein [Sulfuritalea sp.]|nr:DUF748 domain-containing protein [Sulfuritalea sp.]
MILFSKKSRKIALISASGVLAALVVVWLALPGILKSQAEKYIAEKTGHRLTLALPEIDLWNLSLRLGQVRLDDPQGNLLVAFRELFVDLSAKSLSERILIFDAIQLDGLDASLELRKDGGMNWSALFEALKSPEPQPESTGMPRLNIRQLRVAAAQIAFADQRVTPAYATRIDPLDLELSDVSTVPDDAGKFKLKAKTLAGAQLAWEGQVTLNPLASNGHLDIRDINLDRLAPLLQGRLPIAPPSGVAAFAADYTTQQTGGALTLALTRMGVSVASLRVQQMAGDLAPRFAVDTLSVKDGSFDLASGKFVLGAIELLGNRLQQMAGDTAPRLAVDRLSARDGRFELASGQLELGAIELQGNRIEAMLDKKSRSPALKLDQISVADVKVDLRQHTANLASVALKRGDVSARRDAQGRIALLELIDSFAKGPAKSKTQASAPKEENPGAPWRYNIGRVTLADFAVALRDETVAPAVEFGLDNIAIGVDGISEKFSTPLPVRASLDVRSGGRLELSGSLVPEKFSADLKVKLSNLTLKLAQPYVAHLAALDLVGGKASAAGRVQHNVKGSRYRGNFSVHDLRLNEAGTKNVFLAWKSLTTGDLDLDPHHLTITQLQLDGLDTKLIIDKDKTTNLQRVLRKKGAAADRPASAKPAGSSTPSPASAPETPSSAKVAAAKSATPDFLVNIDRLRFRGGAMDFADHSLVLPFATRIHNLRGSIVGLSSKPGVPGKVELDGAVDEFGLAHVDGQVDFFKPTDFMDLKVVFRNIEMTRMTPYSATFAGRKINSGKMSLNLEYKIKQRQLHGENQIVIDRLELGERVESPTASDLPLDLAIALLSDSDGRIDLGVPISGSLDDPQFSYGQIVWKAITNVLSKIITAPFRALGALFGGGGEKLDSIGFEPGASQLTPPEREKLLRLATVLKKRPGLALDIRGTWAELDRGALQDQRVRRDVAAKSGQTVDEKADPGPLSTHTPKVQAALEALFAESFGDAELSVLKDGFRRANPGQMEESLGGRMMSGLSSLLKKKRSLSETEIAQLKGSDFHALLFEKLKVYAQVNDTVLQALATRRAEHALEKLKAAGAPAARVRLGAVEKSEATGREILLKIEIGKADR